MKRVLGYVLFVVMLFVCIAASIKTVYGTESVSGYEVDLVNDSSGIFLTRKNRDTLYVKKIAPEGNEYKYTFENRIVASCIYDNIVYVLYDSAEQMDISYVEQLKNGESKSKTMLINLKHPTITQMSVDGKGNLYIINNKSRVEIYNKNGKHINTLSDAFYSVASQNDKTYASSHNGIFSLGTDSFEKLGAYTDNSPIYRISDNYLGARNGSVYKIKNDISKIMNTGNEVTCSCGETENYLVSFTGNTLNAYDKESGELIGSFPLEYTPEAVSAYNNKVVTLNVEGGNYSFETKSEKIFKKQETNQDDGTQTGTSASLKFGQFKPQGKYIYVAQGTTYSKFKESVTCNGYNISFGDKKSGNIGTNAKVTFTSGAKKKKYTFIVLGDVTGEGNANTRDIDALFAHLLKAGELRGAYKKAADLNGDGRISNADLVLTVRSYENKRK